VEEAAALDDARAVAEAAPTDEATTVEEALGVGVGAAHRGGLIDLSNGPGRGVVGVQLKVVQVLADIVALGADRVSLGAVRAQDRCVLVQAREGVSAAAVLLQTSAVEDVVWLVSHVHNIAPEESSSN
jgi:hypothetical protein